MRSDSKSSTPKPRAAAPKPENQDKPMDHIDELRHHCRRATAIADIVSDASMAENAGGYDENTVVWVMEILWEEIAKIREHGEALGQIAWRASRDTA
jgi:hypothetical protein